MCKHANHGLQDVTKKRKKKQRRKLYPDNIFLRYIFFLLYIYYLKTLHQNMSPTIFYFFFFIRMTSNTLFVQLLFQLSINAKVHSNPINKKEQEREKTCRPRAYLAYLFHVIEYRRTVRHLYLKMNKIEITNVSFQKTTIKLSTLQWKLIKERCKMNTHPPP